jgi:iron transport multicopper oxidase
VRFIANCSGDDGPHPLHIHGREVQLVARGTGSYSAPENTETDVTSSAQEADLRLPNSSPMPATPMRRDTWFVDGDGHAVVRYISDNPGVWFFHCHMEWHLDGVRTTYVLAN